MILTLSVGSKFNDQTDTKKEQIVDKFTQACLRQQFHKTMLRLEGIDYDKTPWNHAPGHDHG